jgi:hypothetical protein
MATTSLFGNAGAPAQELRLRNVLRVALMTALLVGAPMVTRNALAQRSVAVHASTFVTQSFLGARFQPDSAGVPARSMPRPLVTQVRIGGFGMLDVQTGPGVVIRVAPQVSDVSSQPTVMVRVDNTGS